MKWTKNKKEGNYVSDNNRWSIYLVSRKWELKNLQTGEIYRGKTLKSLQSLAESKEKLLQESVVVEEVKETNVADEVVEISEVVEETSEVRNAPEVSKTVEVNLEVSNDVVVESSEVEDTNVVSSNVIDGFVPVVGKILK